MKPGIPRGPRPPVLAIRATCHPGRLRVHPDGRCRRCLVDTIGPQILARIERLRAQAKASETCHCAYPAAYPDDGITACHLCSRVIPAFRLALAR